MSKAKSRYWTVETSAPHRVSRIIYDLYLSNDKFSDSRSFELFWVQESPEILSNAIDVLKISSAQEKLLKQWVTDVREIWVRKYVPQITSETYFKEFNWQNLFKYEDTRLSEIIQGSYVLLR